MLCKIQDIESNHSAGWAYLYLKNNEGEELEFRSISYINSDFPFDFTEKLGRSLLDSYEHELPIGFSYEIDCEGFTEVFVLTENTVYKIIDAEKPVTESILVDSDGLFAFRLFFFYYKNFSEWTDFWDEDVEAEKLSAITDVYTKVKNLYKGLV